MSHAVIEHRQFLDGLSAFREALPEGEPAWLLGRRRDAQARFDSEGLPSSSHERWRQTNLVNVASTVFSPLASTSAGAASSLASTAWATLGLRRLVTVNGMFDASLSDGVKQDGLLCGGLTSLIQQQPEILASSLATISETNEHPFAALNTALFRDGIAIVAAPGFMVREPIQIVHLVTTAAGSFASHPRTLLFAGRGAQLSVIETFVATADALLLTNALTEIHAEEAARVSYLRIQDEPLQGFHFGRVAARVGRNAQIAAFSASFGAALTRNDASVVLDGEGAQAVLDGIYALAGRQQCDVYTTLDHAQPHGASHENYRGVLDAHACAVFNGRIVVRPHAQKTDAIQRNGNLLLSKDATVHTRPQLEIYANDVKCTHGATIGMLRPEAVFYLQSRGIGAQDARRMLVEAFMAETIPESAPQAVRDALLKRVSQLLSTETQP